MLISDGYRLLNEQLHREVGSYGSKSGFKYARRLEKLMAARGIEREQVLDYGCGKGSLVRKLRCRGYDPAMPEYAVSPEPAELVICTDVLEHIEPECLDDVLRDLQRLTRRIGFFVVACRKAHKNLPDGRNTHLIVESPMWWVMKLGEFWTRMSYDITDGGEELQATVEV